MDKISYNKSDILKRVSYKTNMSNNELKIILDSFIDVISEILKEFTMNQVWISTRIIILVISHIFLSKKLIMKS